MVQTKEVVASLQFSLQHQLIPHHALSQCELENATEEEEGKVRLGIEILLDWKHYI
jgi:hypothetical protein